MSRRLPRSVVPYLLAPVVHLLVLLLLAGFYVYATSQPVIGANIGAGMAQLGVVLLGLPWAWLPLAVGPNASEDVEFTVYLACSVLNLALHFAVWLGHCLRVAASTCVALAAST